MNYPRDLREYLEIIEAKGRLVRIKREINKDTELHPLVRLQFSGLPQEERKVFLFENVVDARGKKYDVPVVVCLLGVSRDIAAVGSCVSITRSLLSNNDPTPPGRARVKSAELPATSSIAPPLRPRELVAT